MSHIDDAGRRDLRLVLLVTYGCNLDCRYCCVLRDLRDRRDMPAEVLRKSIDLLFTSSRESLQLHFFGAEPLILPFERYAEALPYANRLARETGKKLKTIVTTNATLLKPHWVELFQREKTSLEISLDGDAESHNANRPQISGRDSYSQIAEALPRLLDAGLGLQVSMVITPETAHRVPENFRHLVSLGFRHIFMMVANCVMWPEDKLEAMREGLGVVLEEYPKIMRERRVVLLNLRDWVWPMRMNTELSVDSDGSIYSACVGYLAKDPELKARCTLGRIESYAGSIDALEDLRLRNAPAMKIVFEESGAVETLRGCVKAGSIMASFVRKLQLSLAGPRLAAPVGGPGA